MGTQVGPAIPVAAYLPVHWRLDDPRTGIASLLDQTPDDGYDLHLQQDAEVGPTIPVGDNFRFVGASTIQTGIASRALLRYSPAVESILLWPVGA